MEGIKFNKGYQGGLQAKGWCPHQKKNKNTGMFPLWREDTPPSTKDTENALNHMPREQASEENNLTDSLLSDSDRPELWVMSFVV